MKIFIEHRGEGKHPWLCILAEEAREKPALNELYWDAQSDDDYCIENSIEWQQDDYKLMFALQVDQLPEVKAE